MLAGDAKVAPSVPFLFQQVTVCVEKDPDGDEQVCDHLGLQVASEGTRSRSAWAQTATVQGGVRGDGDIFEGVTATRIHLPFPLTGCAPR